MRLAFVVAALLIECGVNAQDSLKNASVLSLPLTNKKLVIAHCMTNIIRFKGHKFEDSCDPDYYSPVNNISSPIGGLTQVVPLEDDYLKDAALDETVEFEMRAALKSGIDGFQFYYVLGAKSWDDIIKAYFRVATKKNINFKFTFCISHPKGRTEDAKIKEFADRINGIMDEVGRDNPHWLRTPDGRLVLYMWYGENLADIPTDTKGLPEAFYVARAYKKLEAATHEKFACVYTINEEINAQFLNGILDYFPAVWIWTLPYTDNYLGYMVAGVCKQRHRTFTGSVFGDFYTSKLLRKGTWNIYSVQDAAKEGMQNGERKYVVTGLSYNFRKLLEFNIQQDVSLMNIITWNDYPEGHHLAPEINHNDGFAVLLNYYKSVWKKEPSPYKDKDVAVVFFKKYNHNVNPNPYNIPVIEFESGTGPAATEDSVEVVTLLRASAQLQINNKKFPVQEGLAVSRIAAQQGSINISVSRGGKECVRLNPSEWITDKPYRTDRITYSISSECSNFYKEIFGKEPTARSLEYNLDAGKITGVTGK